MRERGHVQRVVDVRVPDQDRRERGREGLQVALDARLTGGEGPKDQSAFADPRQVRIDQHRLLVGATLQPRRAQPTYV